MSPPLTPSTACITLAKMSSQSNNFGAQAQQFGDEMSNKMQNAANEFQSNSQSAKAEGKDLLDKAEQKLPEAKQSHRLREGTVRPTRQQGR